jgi:hypothetical protein
MPKTNWPHPKHDGRSIFENAEDLILTVNSSGLILTANEHVLGIERLKTCGQIDDQSYQQKIFVSIEHSNSRSFLNVEIE